MKNFYFLASFLTIATFTAKAQENLITNGDFEEWADVNPVNFDRVEITNGSGEVTVYNDFLSEETTIAVSGSSVKQESKQSTQYLEYRTLIPVTPGETYTVSYSYLDNDGAAATRFWSTWLTSSNGTLQGEGVQSNVQLPEYSDDNAEWVHVSFDVTAPAGAAKLRFQLRTYRQGDNSGGFIYYDNLEFNVAPPAGVAENEISGLTMYPNPLSGNVLNITSANNSDMNVAVYDMIGKQVLNTNVVNGTVNVSGLNAGVYMVKVTEEGKTSVKRLIVK